ncbi:hypothetical protein MX569_07080 [Anoxybacillus kestanbolensis]|uniref:hypothetical protein n=1 Tax=Anoxybacillus kestanbolensis TaxID=227476 RepID=UPI00208DB328|nr:hypothetical protein [Anoxybacillus kestanbolensis]MCL9970362.1 hypothetical protein [Anoxybacillus kestanbolensis]
MEKLSYENFVRTAFEFYSGKPVDRWGDPASLANTDYYDDDSLSRVKAAVSYSMEIFNNYIREQHCVPVSDYNLMDQILDSVINAQNTAQITALINQYITSLYNKYIKPVMKI